MLLRFLTWLLAWSAQPAAQAVATMRPGEPVAASACDWSTPVELRGVPRAHTLRWPSLAVHGKVAYLTGNVIPVDSKATLRRQPILLLRIGGRTFSPPVGDFVFMYPQGVFDGKGLYHLVWGEPSTRPRDALAWPLMSNALWHSSYDGSRWSKPKQILSSTDVNWGPNEGQLIANAGTGIQLAVPSSDSAGGSPLWHLRFDSHSWVVQQVGSWAAYATLTSWHRDSVLIMFAGIATGGGGPPNSLSVIHSFDGGISWRPPVPYAGSAAAHARIPILRSRPGDITLSWFQQRSDTLGHEALIVDRSTDGGASWSTLLDTLNGGIATENSFVATSEGRLAGILSMFDGRMTLTEMRGDQASLVTRPLYQTYRQAGLATIASSLGRVMLVFTGIALPDASARLFYTTRRDCSTR